ncbi:MAG: gluconate 2-dehydrogenase subunit 3 family protein [Deinococcota bacterium]
MTEGDRAQEVLAALLAGEHVTPATSQVLEKRLSRTFERRFFSETEFTRLQAAAVRLVPHDPVRLDLAGAVDDRLANGRTDGWRYADAPPDPQAYRELLAALPEDLMNLDGPAQDDLLRTLQLTHPHPFEDLLAELTEAYYSHPLVQLELGSLSFADAPKWTRIGLGELEAREQEAWEALGLKGRP